MTESVAVASASDAGDLTLNRFVPRFAGDVPRLKAIADSSRTQLVDHRESSAANRYSEAKSLEKLLTRAGFFRFAGEMRRGLRSVWGIEV